MSTSLSYIYSILATSIFSSIDSCDRSTITALEEACCTTYLNGRWLQKDSVLEHAYKVVETVIQGDQHLHQLYS